jgi:HPt (histidine-containing phosphotransfer) domain-containing protein
LDPDIDVLKSAGIDTVSGLKLTGGRPQRYEALLRKFAERQGDTVATIRAALSSGEYGDAERAAHSLRGAASSLGAMRLSEAAAKTEAALKTGQGVEEALAALSNSLGTVVEAIRRALPD